MNTDSKQRAATFELALEYAVRRMIEIDALCHGTNYCPGCRDKHLDIEEAVECAKSHFLFEAKRALNKKNKVTAAAGCTATKYAQKARST